MRSLLLALILCASPTLALAQHMLIDDFETPGQASLGGRWSWSTDQVMGGVSDGQAQYVPAEGGQGIHLQGQVSTANNGGFIQISLAFAGLLDASDFTGIELRVRGDGQPYYLHLRDRNTRLPWQVFTARYETSGSWQSVRVPFSAFAPYSSRTGGTLDPSALRRIGLVAGYADTMADLTIGDVRFY